jgi:hypothetical protein
VQALAVEPREVLHIASSTKLSASLGVADRADRRQDAVVVEDLVEGKARVLALPASPWSISWTSARMWPPNCHPSMPRLNAFGDEAEEHQPLLAAQYVVYPDTHSGEEVSLLRVTPREE